MHQSRVGSIVIDCEDLGVAVAFWSAVLGLAPEGEWDPVAGQYVSLGALPQGVRVLLQRVPEKKTSKSRVHIDIETDDVDAEMARLESLGAKRTTRVGEVGWVLEDPCGNEFCILIPRTPGFPDRALGWTLQ